MIQDIKALEQKIAWAKSASVFDKGAAIESALHQLVSILKKQNEDMSNLHDRVLELENTQ